jgi:hypothetical protein
MDGVKGILHEKQNPFQQMTINPKYQHRSRGNRRDSIQLELHPRGWYGCLNKHNQRSNKKDGPK